MTHLAMLDVDDEGNSATWGDHVTDIQYEGDADVQPTTETMS